MSDLTRHAVRGLLQPHAPPCVSLYQPTHRHHPDNQQDPIRFKNLLRDVETSLRQRYTGVDDLLAPFRALGEDAAFWNHTLDGLAVLGAPGVFRVFRVQRPVGELALVADTFHVKPLLRVVQSSDRYQVLCVTRQSARVFEGNRDALDELEAAVEGRVSHVLLEAGRVRSGRLDPVTGAIADLVLDDPTVGDMLDDLAEAVLRTGGEVVVVPTERMPSDTGLAASFRY